MHGRAVELPVAAGDPVSGSAGQCAHRAVSRKTGEKDEVFLLSFLSGASADPVRDPDLSVDDKGMR